MRSEMLCPAKINLHLAVGPRDLAGPSSAGTHSPNSMIGPKTKAYHRICTLLQAVYLYKGAERSINNTSIDKVCSDVLELELKDATTLDKSNLSNYLQSKIRIDCQPASPCAEHENLVYRAAKSYLEHYQRQYGPQNWPGQLQFRLKKQIPQQAGLGGGSSDAAAALKLLNQMLPVYCGCPALSELPQIAAELGADVAFFLQDFSNTIRTITTITPEQNRPSSLAWGLEWGQKIVPLSDSLALQKWQSCHQLWIRQAKECILLNGCDVSAARQTAHRMRYFMG